MSKPELLLLRAIYQPAMAELAREFTVHKLWCAADSAQMLKDVGPRIRALVTPGIIGFTRAQVEALPKLEIIAMFGGNATLDLSPARERGIAVTNTPDSIAEAVADLAIGLMIASMRRICECDRYVRTGTWPTTVPPVGREVRGKVCGVVGLGAIGRGVARRAEACGMAVRYQGPRCKSDVPYPYHEDVLSLARESDCLVVTCPLTPQTRNLIDARVLDALGAEGFLINVARGAILDEAALIAALTEKRIAGAGLDVYRDEPQVSARSTTWCSHRMSVPPPSKCARNASARCSQICARILRGSRCCRRFVDRIAFSSRRVFFATLSFRARAAFMVDAI